MTGVWAVPAHHHAYASVAGEREVAVIDRSLAVAARIGGIRTPELAYAPEAGKALVSDESGDVDDVINARCATARRFRSVGRQATRTTGSGVTRSSASATPRHLPRLLPLSPARIP